MGRPLIERQLLLNLRPGQTIQRALRGGKSAYPAVAPVGHSRCLQTLLTHCNVGGGRSRVGGRHPASLPDSASAVWAGFGVDLISRLAMDLPIGYMLTVGPSPCGALHLVPITTELVSGVSKLIHSGPTPAGTVYLRAMSLCRGIPKLSGALCPIGTLCGGGGNVERSNSLFRSGFGARRGRLRGRPRFC